MSIAPAPGTNTAVVSGDPIVAGVKAEGVRIEKAVDSAARAAVGVPERLVEQHPFGDVLAGFLVGLIAGAFLALRFA